MKSKIALFSITLAIAVFGLLPTISQASDQNKTASCCAVQAACCAPSSACCEAGIKKEKAKQQVQTSANDCCAPGAACCVPGAACCS